MEKYGFIITVETYQNKLLGIGDVAYATNDGSLMQEIFEQKLGVPAENIHVYRDSQFTMSSCQYSLYPEIEKLPENSTLYLYYAGHGFFIEGENCCTLYDTNLSGLRKTMVSFNEFFMDAFKKSKGRTCIAFIDACARPYSESDRAITYRYFTEDEEYDDFDRKGFEYAILCACSPGQGSRSDDALQHGVWTKMLSDALAGKTELGNDISANKLVEYLNRSVNNYCMDSTDEFKIQNCYCLMSGTGDVLIKTPDENEIIAFFEDYYENLQIFFKQIKYHYNEIINADPSIDVYENYLIARDILLEVNPAYDGDWDMDISFLQLISREIEAGDDNVSETQRRKVMEVLAKLILATR